MNKWLLSSMEGSKPQALTVIAIEISITELDSFMRETEREHTKSTHGIET